MKRFIFLSMFFLFGFRILFAQSNSKSRPSSSIRQAKKTPLAFTPNSGSGSAEKFSIDSGKVIVGVASYYHDKFEGRKTSNGEVFDQNKLTAASNIIPLGTWVRIVNPENDSSVVVFINDRMHPKNRRLLDLSKAAAKQLGYLHFGLIRVQAELLGNSMPLMNKN